MIHVSVETTGSDAKMFKHITDLDFAYARNVLQDESYAMYFSTRSRDRQLILSSMTSAYDTSMVPIPHLLRAAKLVHADYVIAPYYASSEDKSFRILQAASEAFENTPHRVAMILQGKTAEARKSHLAECWNYMDMVCLRPGHSRMQWYLEQQTVLQSIRLHLFGTGELYDKVGRKGQNATMSEISCFYELEKSRDSRDPLWSVSVSLPMGQDQDHILDHSLDHVRQIRIRCNPAKGLKS